MAEKTENQHFLALDFGSDILKLNKAQLTTEEQQALESFKKLNIVGFKKNESNQELYQTELAEVQSILKNNSAYEKLMSYGSGQQGASIYVVGKDDYFDEFIVFGNQKETGFLIVRVLGKDMNVNHVMSFASLLEKSEIDRDQLKSLEGFFNSKSDTIPDKELETTTTQE
jgi:hypothetical protein